MKKSLFSKLVLSRLKVSSKQEEQRLRAKIDVYLRNVDPMLSQEQFIYHLESLDYKFDMGITNLNPNMSKEQNLL